MAQLFIYYNSHKGVCGEQHCRQTCGSSNHNYDKSVVMLAGLDLNSPTLDVPEWDSKSETF